MGGNHRKVIPNKRLFIRTAAVLVALVGVLAIATTAWAQSGQIGNYCVHDYQLGAVCTANDVRIEELRIATLIEGCGEGTIGELEGQFEALVSADGSPDRYDIGLFLALDGGLDTALTGDNCFHDYLEPPLSTSPTYGDHNSDSVPDIYNGPWWNAEPSDTADTCGDIATDSQVFKVLQTLRVPCVDNDGDGAADIHVCASWDNNAGTTCSGLTSAFPGTNSKCSCSIVNMPFTTNATTVTEFAPHTDYAALAGAVVGIALIFGLVVLMARHRRARRALSEIE